MKLTNASLYLLHNQIDVLRLWFFNKTKVKLEQIKEETNERFQRLTGVKQSTFDVPGSGTGKSRAAFKIAKRQAE